MSVVPAATHAVTASISHSATGSGALAALEATLQPLKDALCTHPLYAALADADSLRVFMQSHVFAVWDFQCLLKSLQRSLTCVAVPWLPTDDPAARRMINEIVLEEESGLGPDGSPLSHFELYLAAMRAGGADTSVIGDFLESLRAGVPLVLALNTVRLPPGTAAFVRATVESAQKSPLHVLAAEFAYGREDVIPSMFHLLVRRLSVQSPAMWDTLRFYLELHIATDGEQHGPQARRLVGQLCADDDTRWAEATDAAVAALQRRKKLWDSILAQLG